MPDFEKKKSKQTYFQHQRLLFILLEERKKEICSSLIFLSFYGKSLLVPFGASH